MSTENPWKKFPRRGSPEWKDRRKAIAAAIRYADSYTRMDAVVEAWPYVRPRAWLRILGREWSGCDNIHAFVPLLRVLLANVDLADMMTPAERRRLAGLPKTFTAYRGCYAGLNEDGVSYSLHRDEALRFAGHYMRYRAEGRTPVLVTARCQRSRSVLKLDRDEQEVIALRRRIVSIEEVTTPSDAAAAAAA